MNDTISFQDAVECAKKFENFEGVLMAVTLHPEWLIAIEGDRIWAIIHHVVYSGKIDRLDQLLAQQKFNRNFRLLVNTRLNETLLEIAKVLNDQGKMYKHIERLVKLDEMLDYAKTGQWDLCYEIVKANPSYGNEKPPYRRFYLIHHIAFVNEIKQFERFQNLDNFEFIMNLRADRKKINVIAREGNGIDFAKYIETNYPAYFDENETDNELYEASQAAKDHTNKVRTLMEERNVVNESNFHFGPAENIVRREDLDKEMKLKLLQLQQEKEQPKNATNSILNQPMDSIRNLLTCALTNAIVTDPVVAADGFTYERTAIENWLKTNDHSPMTNERLAHKNLNPNKVVQQILATITEN